MPRKKTRSRNTPPIIVWFRRNLRLCDHPALHAAAETGHNLIHVYVLDDETPGEWRMGGASRWWLAQSLRDLASQLEKNSSNLMLRRGVADDVLPALAKETGAQAVYFTRGYEPWQRPQEDRLRDALEAAGVECKRYGGQILFEPEKFLNKAGEPFRVYTPFFRQAASRPHLKEPLPAPKTLQAPETWPGSDRLSDWGLEPHKPDWAGGLRETWVCGEAAAQKRLSEFIDTMLAGYAGNRNTPGMDGTSRLSPHLAFGEIGPRQIWHAVLTAAEKAGDPDLGETYLKEIVWREFSYHLLFHFPDFPNAPYREEFQHFAWQEDKAGLKAWQKGQTGYPIVDAGMRQLWQKGWMHNRVRMIAASFLIKHLLIPWQTGQDWYWDTLVDADLASNSASWQWVAGSGADAAPYFRIFNPVLQGEKFDAGGGYVRQFVPELAQLPNAYIHKPWEAPAGMLLEAGVRLGETYPRPLVAHDMARKRALAAFQNLKKTA